MTLIKTLNNELRLNEIANLLCLFQLEKL
jgi:hypothetical protein